MHLYHVEGLLVENLAINNWLIVHYVAASSNCVFEFPYFHLGLIQNCKWHNLLKLN